MLLARQLLQDHLHGLGRRLGDLGLLRLDLDRGRVRGPLGLGAVVERLPALAERLRDERLLLLAADVRVVALDGGLDRGAVLLLVVLLARELPRRDGRDRAVERAVERVVAALLELLRDDALEDRARAGPLLLRDRRLLRLLGLRGLDLVLGRGRGPRRLGAVVEALPPRAEDLHDLLVLLLGRERRVRLVGVDLRLDACGDARRGRDPFEPSGDALAKPSRASSRAARKGGDESSRTRRRTGARRVRVVHVARHLAHLGFILLVLALGLLRFVRNRRRDLGLLRGVGTHGRRLERRRHGPRRLHGRRDELHRSNLSGEAPCDASGFQKWQILA